MIISAIPILEEKEGLVDFSNPYYVLEYMLVSLNEAQIKIKEDLQGKKIGILEVEEDDLSMDYLVDYKIKTFDDIFIMFEELSNKEIEGILLSLPIGVEIMKESEGKYTILDIVESEKEYGIVFRKEHILKQEVDRILEEIVESGIYDIIYNTWFEYDY
jgi:polar amino acid transport system substrate-binding protein